MKKTVSVAVTALLVAVVAACSSGSPPIPRLGGGVAATCKLFWTYQSTHDVPVYRSFTAAYKADMAEYRQPQGTLYRIMPVLEPTVRITAASTVDIGNVEVAFYDGSGDETGHRAQLAVNKSLARGQSYSAADTAEAWGLSDPETGHTSVTSCAAAAWTRRHQS